MLLTLAWRNIWRNRSRSLITMASVGSAVVLATLTVSLQKGVFDNLIANVVSFYTGYVQVHRVGYWKEQTLENSFHLSDSLSKKVLGTHDVRYWTPRLESFALLSSGEKTKGCMVAGIAPESEDMVTRLKSKLVAGDYLTDSSRQVLVGEGLAKRLGAGVGDTLVLLGQGYFGTTAAGKFAVGGLLHFGSPELNERLVFMPLARAQEWLDAPEMVTTMVISPVNPSKSGAAAAGLHLALSQNEFEVMRWEEMMPDIEEHIRTDTASSKIILGVLYLLISFGIFATLLMMLIERRREFGMLVALGMKKAQLARVVLAESILLTLTGCLAGLLISLPIVWWLRERPIRIGGETAKTFEKFGFEAVFPAAFEPNVFLEQASIVLAVGLILAIYPVVNVLRLKPVEAMR
jgi:ABC-type lipoprotein release transport system permease subunit